MAERKKSAMSDNSKDQFDALIRLAEFKRAVREGRRQFEWKFTAMALLALAGLSVAPANFWVTVAGALGLCVFHTWWVILNNHRNERDRVDMYHYKDKAEELLPEKLRCDNSDWVKGPISLCKQQLGIIQIVTVYAVGCFAIAVRYCGSS